MYTENGDVQYRNPWLWVYQFSQNHGCSMITACLELKKMMKKGLTKVFYYTRKGQRAHAYLIKNKQFEQGSLRLLKQMESMCIHVESKLKKGWVGGS